MTTSLVQILPDIVINKIAAGEVVERPASAVKELVENALDADATEITIDIKDGGLTLIRVADNGQGMSSTDLLLAVRRHATSKIRRVEDLEAIDSLGFRGEALPSIASVSRTVVTTCTPDSVGGVQLQIDGGIEGALVDCPRSAGTTVEVHTLFHNIPARRKFLKSASTEVRHISRVVTEYAMVYEDVTFVLTHNGRRMFRYYAVTDSADRMAALFGRATAEKMLPCDYRTEGLTVTGFVGKPEIARNSSRFLTLFVNRRAIVNRSLNHAITEGFRSLLQRGEYPFVVLFLTVDPAKVDVNVHPAKREVRFVDERYIYSHVLRAIKGVLAGAELIPEFGLPMHTSYTPGGPSASVRAFMNSQRPTAEEVASSKQPSLSFDHHSSAPTPQADEVQEVPLPQEPTPPVGGFWQVRNSFIFSATDEGVLIIDQHAAHERILFEEALAGMEETRVAAQQMLFPITVELTHPEFVVMEKVLPYFIKLGFGIRIFGGTSVVVDALPASVRGWNEGRLLKDMLDELAEYGTTSADYVQKIAASYACKAAVKAGDPLKEGEIAYLVHRLFQSSQPYTCPHGRPCTIKMTFRELEKKFGRTT